MNFVKFTILMFFVASCSTPNWYKPHGYKLFSLMPKGGTPGYNLGWVHGCESGAGTQFGGAVYQTFYTWYRDPDISSSRPDIEKIRKRYGKKELKDVNWSDSAEIKRNFSDYNLVFWDAHYFCRQTILGTLQLGDMDPPLPGETRYNPSAHHLGSVYKLNGKNDPRLGSQRSGGFW